MARELVPHKRIIPPVEIDENRLETLLTAHMQRLEQTIKSMQRIIPIYVDEYLYMQNSTALQLTPQSQNLELVTAIIAIVTAPGGGTLTLGGSLGTVRTIPLPQGNTIMQLPGNGMLLNNGDQRKIVQGTAGILGLELLGIELPDKGVW